LFALQFYFFQRDYRRDLQSVADIIANLSGPTISLGAPESTKDFLEALKPKQNISGAFIRVADGSVATKYGRITRDFERRPPAADGFHTMGGELVYVHPIIYDQQRLGTIYLVSDYRERSIRLHGLYASILVAVLASSFLVAVIVSSKLERVISGPIHALAETAREIAHRSDYSLRAKKQASDEVGEFTDTFNGMLDQIQNRDAALRHEVAERTRAERELQLMQHRLVDASRQAGMAEVATGVLHNVGNVLNSVNVSATLIAEKLNGPRIGNLVRAAQLLRDQNGSLHKFLTEDTKGKLLPSYLAEAGEQLALDRTEALSELELLTKNVEHIKDIVSMQQSYARVSGMLEKLGVEDLVEDAIRMNAGAFERHQVTLVRDYEPVPDALLDKHKFLQILVNLMRNAKYAMDEGGNGEKKLTLRIRSKGESIITIDVIDTGTGIPPENLTRIFSHGFTTRKEGHGFGLHSSALAAREMGGSLTAYSEGKGHGARFTLELPIALPSAVVVPQVA
jgi:signal transduction histidine kinase